jgi:hypothetical protein
VTSVEEAAAYVRPGDDPEKGYVHLEATRFIKNGRSKRQVGEFFCEPARRAKLATVVEATRTEFLIDACPQCLEACDRLGVDVGAHLVPFPGPYVTLFTTSPPKIDAPYARRGDVAGHYAGVEVRSVGVPLDLREKALKRYRMYDYHCWDGPLWEGLVAGGRAKAV